MKKYVAIVSLVVLLTGLVPALAAAQESSKVEFSPYAVVFATKGPNYKTLTAEESQEARMKAVQGLREALIAGEIIIAGLVTDGSAEFIMIVDTNDEGPLREMIKNAPNVKKGIYDIKVFSWYAPAGLTLETKPLVR